VGRLVEYKVSQKYGDKYQYFYRKIAVADRSVKLVSPNKIHMGPGHLKKNVIADGRVNVERS
jgi:hypothetical protein